MSEVVRFADAEPADRGDGIETVVLTPAVIEGQTFLMGITTFPPGTRIREHCHNTVEQVVVIEGSGVVEIDGKETAVGLHDATQVEPGVYHRFRNDHSDVMRILWVYGGTHVTRTYADTGETVLAH
ncbi:MAG: cupin domain-containing protein [Acidimicrobiia bacterium]